MIPKNSISLSIILFLFFSLSYGQNNPSLIDLIYNEEYEKAKQLITTKKGINKRDENNATPFMWAIYKNQLDLVKLLKKNGAKVNLKGVLIDDDDDLYVGSPLAVAALKADLEMVKFLVLNIGILATIGLGTFVFGRHL